MDIHQKWKRSEDIVIDMADLMRGVCRKWRQALVCAVAFAVLFGGYGSLKSKKAQDTDNPESAVASLELSQAEQQDVMAAVGLSAEIQNLKEYMENSVMMEINPYHKNRAVILYSITSTGGLQLQDIVESYLNFINNGGAAAALAKSRSSGLDIDTAYLEELVSAGQKLNNSPYQLAAGSTPDSAAASTVFYVEVTGKDSAMVGKITAIIQSALEELYPSVKKTAGSHKLKFLSREETVITDSSLQSAQREKRAFLSSDTQSLNALVDTFSNGQKAAYQELSGRQMQEGQETEAEAGMESSFNIARGIKYALLGIACGIFIFCFAFGCRYLFQDTVKSVGEIKRMYSFPFYGSVAMHRKTAASKGSRQEQILIMSRIKLACKKQGITGLALVSGFPLDGREKECMLDIRSQLKEWEIDAWIAEDAFADAAKWDAIAQTGNALMVCRIGTTTHQMVDGEMEFYMENGISVMGAMVFV